MKSIKEKIMGCVGDYLGKGAHNAGGFLGSAAQLGSQTSTSTATGKYVTGGWSDPRLRQQQPAYNNALAQSMLQTMQTKLAAQQAAMNNAFGSMAQSTTLPLGHYHLENNPDVTFDELNDEGSVYNMPIQTAIDLAINKFGSRWFKDEETVPALEENKEFWLNVMAKLFKAGHLQKETVSDFERDQRITAWKIVDTAHADN